MGIKRHNAANTMNHSSEKSVEDINPDVTVFNNGCDVESYYGELREKVIPLLFKNRIIY